MSRRYVTEKTGHEALFIWEILPILSLAGVLHLGAALPSIMLLRLFPGLFGKHFE